jgi:membrane protein
MLEKLTYFLKNNALSKQLISWSKKIVLPGFEGMTLYITLHFLLKSFGKSQYGIRSSAISFKFFMALFPGIIFFLSLIPYIPIENFQSNLLDGLGNMLPNDVYTLIESTINDLINHKHSGVLSIGFFLSLYFASNGINTLLTAFNSSHQLQLKRKPIRQRLISLGIFGIISVSFIIALSAIMLGEYFAYNKDYQSLGFAVRTGYQLLKWGIIIISLILAISTLYNLGNTERTGWKFISAGATLSTIIIIIASYGLTFFFGNFGKYNELYGSIGSLLMILIWINVVSYIMLVGFELSTRGNVNTKQKSVTLAPDLN